MVKTIYAKDILWQTEYDLKRMLENEEKTGVITAYLEKQIEKLHQKSNTWIKVKHD